MTDDELRARAAEEVARFGPWTDHVRLAPGVEVGPATPHMEALSRDVHAACEALSPAVRYGHAVVLDLAARNGAIYAGFAAAGCTVLAVEGDEGNCRKLRFLNEARDWPGVTVIRAEAADFPAPAALDVILACGVLDGRRAAAAIGMLHDLAEARPGVLALDGGFAEAPDEVVRAMGRDWHYRAGPAADRLVAEEVIATLAGRFRPILEYAVPRVRAADDPLPRRLLFCVRPPH